MSFYTVPAMSNTLMSFFERLGGDAYTLSVVAIELLLIGLCVNWCAGVLQGTRGTRPLRGVLIILVGATMVVRVLAVQFGWVRLDLLYSYILYGLAFIALVVFQPELRRAVIRVGDVRFRRRGTPQSQLVSALVKSAGYLSKNRHGGLLAIQRSVDLTGWAENGTLINAEVSANLLNTVFFPNSPLHDLGVIIRGSRVVAANCQFPSAESDEIDAALGSRHLAAVGMSYETDALVLVISEETGVVSLADNGELTRYLSLDDLADELTDRLTGRAVAERQQPRRKRAFSAFWRRVRRLLVVVPLTAVIWYLADQATFATDNLKVELTLRHDTPARIVDVYEPNPLVFNATLSGPGRAIDLLRVDSADQPLRLTWILPAAYAGLGEYTLSEPELRRIIEESREISERGLSVVNISLERLLFQVDELVPLSVPVRVQADGGRVRIVVEHVDPPVVEVVIRRSLLPRLPMEEERFVRALLGERLRGMEPETGRTFEGIPLEERLGTVDVTAITPREVKATVRVVGKTAVIKNVRVHLFVSPAVLERYQVGEVDFNEWLIEVAVQGAETAVEALEPVDLYALALVSSDVLPPAGQPLVEQLRTVELTIVPKVPGVTVVGERTVRVNLIPRPGAGS